MFAPWCSQRAPRVACAATFEPDGHRVAEVRVGNPAQAPCQSTPGRQPRKASQGTQWRPDSVYSATAGRVRRNSAPAAHSAWDFDANSVPARHQQTPQRGQSSQHCCAFPSHRAHPPARMYPRIFFLCTPVFRIDCSVAWVELLGTGAALQPSDEHGRPRLRGNGIVPPSTASCAPWLAASRVFWALACVNVGGSRVAAW